MMTQYKANDTSTAYNVNQSFARPQDSAAALRLYQIEGDSIIVSGLKSERKGKKITEFL